MPLPLGHTAIGWAAYETANAPSPTKAHYTLKSRIAMFTYVTLLANLPDLDILFGLVFNGNGASLHRGPTHSLFFALAAGYLASHGWRLSRWIPRFGFGLCTALVASHVAADMLLTNSPVSLLWPFELYLSPGHSSWGEVMRMVLFRSIQDAGILLGCMIYVPVLRLVRSRRPVFPLFAFARRRVK